MLLIWKERYPPTFNSWIRDLIPHLTLLCYKKLFPRPLHHVVTSSDANSSEVTHGNVSDITLLLLEPQKASYNFCRTCSRTIQHLYNRLWCVKSVGKNNSLPLALCLLAQLLPEPKPSEDSGEPLLHPNSPHLPHFSSEMEAAGQTLYLEQSASVGSTTKAPRYVCRRKIAVQQRSAPSPQGPPADSWLCPRRFPGTCCDLDRAQPPAPLG